MRVKGFKIICENCGSANTRVHVEEGEWYSEDTGGEPPSLEINCQDCGSDFIGGSYFIGDCDWDGHYTRRDRFPSTAGGIP